MQFIRMFLLHSVTSLVVLVLTRWLFGLNHPATTPEIIMFIAGAVTICISNMIVQLLKDS
jgi:hypothetical protein